MINMHCLFLILVMLPEKVLIFNYYSSVFHVLFYPICYIAYSGESKKEAMCSVFGEAKGKVWGYLLCIPVRIHSTPVKGKPTSHRLLLGNVPLHHRNGAVDDAPHSGIPLSLTPICRSPTALWSLVLPGSPSTEFSQGSQEWHPAEPIICHSKSLERK